MYNALERQGDEELSDTKKQLIEYIRFVVEEQWPALRKVELRPSDHELFGRKVLNRVRKDLDKIEYIPGNLNLKGLLDQVEDFRNQRLFGAKGKLLPVFWYIAIIGYLFTLLTLYLPPPHLDGAFWYLFTVVWWPLSYWAFLYSRIHTVMRQGLSRMYSSGYWMRPRDE
ncbi:MAG: hypothetical protein JRF62_00395 [Deltaproteobacteria bacterium]|nr:hypothetical protein [Deltaproteobacteria bacterium]MBW2638584.1 hypothetical protein [Deltaproteobacteria bacterium]